MSMQTSETRGGVAARYINTRRIALTRSGRQPRTYRVNYAQAPL